MENLKQYCVVGLICFSIGAGVVYKTMPAKIETKIEQVTKEVEVIKKDVIIVTEKITQKDGTIIEKTRTEDKSSSSSQKDTSLKSSNIVSNEKKWRVGASAGVKSIVDPVPVYGARVEYKILGPFSIGIYGSSRGEAGISLSFDF